MIRGLRARREADGRMPKIAGGRRRRRAPIANRGRLCARRRARQVDGSARTGGDGTTRAATWRRGVQGRRSSRPERWRTTARSNGSSGQIACEDTDASSGTAPTPARATKSPRGNDEHRGVDDTSRSARQRPNQIRTENTIARGDSPMRRPRATRRPSSGRPPRGCGAGSAAQAGLQAFRRRPRRLNLRVVVRGAGTRRAHEACARFVAGCRVIDRWRPRTPVASSRSLLWNV